MQLNSDILARVTWLVGSAEITKQLPEIPALIPFDENVVACLDEISRALMKDPRAKNYPDVITFAFWIRKANILKMKERFGKKEGLQLGKGIVFHVAPSNVPVNFAYSLAAGFLMGNANIVRVPGKEYPQVGIITEAINNALKKYKHMNSYILCVRYDHDKAVNDQFSSIADERVIWGGDQTIAELRRSPLPPRSGEVTFADRYSLAVVDADVYLAMKDKVRVAEDFYNDTFLSDQNACTSPRLVVWTGQEIEKAKGVFWAELHKLVRQRYAFQPVQGVNKLTKSYWIAAIQDVKIETHSDNRIIRVKVQEITEELMDYRDNCGFFYEYDCEDIMDLVPLCNDKRCQTIGYIGDKNQLIPLITAGMKGIDRIVPVGKTMDFDLIWDGYDLPAHLSRTIVLK